LAPIMQSNPPPELTSKILSTGSIVPTEKGVPGARECCHNILWQGVEYPACRLERAPYGTRIPCLESRPLQRTCS
jgi:hypothetical protein